MEIKTLNEFINEAKKERNTDMSIHAPTNKHAKQSVKQQIADHFHVGVDNVKLRKDDTIQLTHITIIKSNNDKLKFECDDSDLDKLYDGKANISSILSPVKNK